MGITIANSSDATKDEIKALSRQDLNTQIGITVASQSGLNSAEAVGTANSDDIAVIKAQIDDPDPGNVFSMTVASNTLNAAIATVITPTFKSYKIVVDDDTEPTSGFTAASSIQSSYTLADWDAHTYYLWVTELDDTVTQIEPSTSDPNNDGASTPGLVVTATDTLGPVFSTVSIAAGTAAETQIAITYADPTDAGSGFDRVDVHRTLDDGLVVADYTSGANISNLTPGETYYWYLKAYDSAGNTTDYSLEAHTTTALSGGTVEFTAASFEEDQDSTPLAVTLKRTGGSSGAISVDVSTVDRTATAGVNYTAVSGSTVNWADGNTDVKTVNVTVAASPVLTSNDMFEIQIDYGSESSCTVGAVSSALCKINSSSAGIAGHQQETSGNYILSVEAEDSNNTIVDAIYTGKTTDGFDESSTDSRYSPRSGGVGTLLEATIAGSFEYNATETTWGDCPRGYYLRIPCNFADSTEHDIWLRRWHAASGTTGDFTHFTIERPVASIGANDSGPGSTQLITLDHNHGWANASTHVVFFEGSGNDSDAGNTYTFTATVNGDKTFHVPNSSLTAQDAATCDSNSTICMGGAEGLGVYAAATGGSSQFYWTHVDKTDTTNRVFTPFTGQICYVRIYGVSYQCEVDKMVLVPTSVSYDPSNVDNDPATSDHGFGPAISTYSSTSVTDNPNNPTSPSIPLPSTELAATTYYPAHTDTNIPLNGLVVQAEYAGTDLQYEKFEVYADGVEISGSIFVESSGTGGSAASTISFVASAPLSSADACTVELLGTIRDNTDNSLKKIERTGSEWTWTMIDTGAGSTLLSVDFSAHSATTSPYTYTETDIESDWISVGNTARNVHNFAGGGDYAITGPNKGRLHIVDDPATIPTRGKVLRVTAPGGNVDIGACMNFAVDFGTAQADPYDDSGVQEVYCSYDMFLTENHVFPTQNKMPGLFTGTRLEASHAAETPTAEGELAFSITPQLFGPSAWGTTAFSSYIYDALLVQGDDFWDTVDDDINLYPNRDLAGQNPYVPSLGRWVTIEQYIDLGTVPGDGTADGILRVWVTDPGQWAGPKLVLEDTARRFVDNTKEMSINRFWMSLGYGGNSAAPDNRLDVAQYHYFDNFIISTSRITG